MKEAFVRSSSLSSSSTSLVTPADAGGDLRLWDDPRIVEEAAKNAVTLATEASGAIGSKAALDLFEPVSRVLAWCIAFRDKLAKVDKGEIW